MSRQKTNQDRSMLNDARLYLGVVSGLESLLSCVRMPEGRNAIFGSGDLNRCMMGATIRDSSVGGCANASKEAAGSAVPSDRWCAGMIKGVDAGCLQERFMDSVRHQIQILEEHGRMPADGLTVAVDMHLIPRYDKRPGAELTRSRYKKETKCFERYMTAQCVDGGIRLKLGAAYLGMFDSVPDSLHALLESVGDAGARVRLVLLDREFFSIGAMESLQRHGVPFLIPCRNTGNVVAVLREFAQERRGMMSKNVLEDGSRSLTYDMVITKRKSVKDPTGPEERYIGFATNVSTAETGQYAARWGVETGYRLVEEMRPKTRISDVAARMFCFYYALVAYNEWTILRMLCSDDSRRQSAMTQLVFKFQMESLLIREPKPPP